MANPWPTQYGQQDHIPSSSDTTGPAGRWETTARPDPNSVIQGCPCPLCSVPRHSDPPARRTMEQQNPGLPDEAAVPFSDQNLGASYPIGTAAMTNGQTQSVAPQHPNQDVSGYARPHEQVRLPQVQTGAGLDQAQVVNMLVMESLRHVARHYVNRPESLVNTVRLEPGAAGRFRVVIVLEVTDIRVTDIP